MKYFKVVLPLVALLSLVEVSFAAGRRRVGTARPPTQRQRLKTSSLPPLRTRNPTNGIPNLGAPPIRRFYATSAPLLRQSQLECRKSHEILPHARDPTFYRICVPVGRNWIVYAYRCPNGAEFNPDINKCVLAPPRNIQTAISTTFPPTATNSGTTESDAIVVPISEENKEITQSAAFAKPLTTTHHEFIDNLQQQPSPSNSAKIMGTAIAATTQNSKSIDGLRKITTWRSVSPVPTSTPTRPMDEDENEIMGWITTTTTTTNQPNANPEEVSTPLTRTKVSNAEAYLASLKERFPGLRPNSLIH